MKKLFVVVFSLLIPSLIFMHEVNATTYYVAGDTGGDSNLGGSSAPWQTIQKAANTMVAGDTVNVKGGLTYNESVAISVSGSIGNLITYQSWPGTGIPSVVANGGNVFNLANSSASYIVIDGFKMTTAINYSGVVIAQNNNYVTVKNSLIIANTGTHWGIEHDGGGHGIGIYNNTIYGAFQYGMRMVTLGAGAGWTCDEGGDFFVKNNEVVGAAVGINIASPLGANFSNCYNEDYNGFYGNSANYSVLTPGAHDILTNPQFNNAAGGDFTLKTISPVINAGINLTSYGVTIDILGHSRPQGSGFDIGAYEYYDMPVTLDALAQNPTNNTTPTFTGTASTVAGATITSIAYSIDSGAWTTSGVTGTTSFSITPTTPLTEGNHDIRVRATDSCGISTGSSMYGTQSFSIDLTPPTGTIIINSGSEYTNTASVTLHLNATDNIGVSEMMISDNSNFSGAAWESYATTKSWTLTDGDGSKTVYVHYQDSLDNVSDNYSASIVLDIVAPEVHAGVAQDAYPNTDLTFIGTATDNESGVANVLWTQESGPDTVTFGTDNSLTTTARASIPEIYTLRLTATDGAGNPGYSELQMIVHGYGDINNDGIVNEDDFTLLMFNWGNHPVNPLADYTRDGQVNEDDFTILMYWWGTVPIPI